MSELPLFPLKTVVFPGMPMPLHIFEERYKLMINECLEAQRPFGIVCIAEGEAEYDNSVQPCRVGCTVDIMQVQRLEDGRLFIMTVGQERFRITQLMRSKKPYLVGDVTMMPFLDESPETIADAADNLERLLHNYLEVLVEAGTAEVDFDGLPQEPSLLAGVAASLLDISLDKKQLLLESKSLSTVIDYLSASYQKELNLLQMLPKEGPGVFSLN